MSNCDKCGTLITEGDKFCSNCGYPVALSPPPPPPPEQDLPLRASPVDDLFGRPRPRATADKENGKAKSGFPLATVLAVLGLMLGGVVLFFLVRWDSDQSDRLAAVQRSLDLINGRLEQNDQRIAGLQSEAQVLQEHVGLTESELKRAKAVAQKLQEEQQRHVAVLSRQIATKADSEKVEDLKEQSETKIAVVSEDVAQVRDEVRTGQQELEKTRAELSKLGVVVTEQGTMIATTSTGLDELRRRGERDYFTFDVTRKQKGNLAGVVLELRKADVGKQFVDFKLYVDDRVVEHKKIYVNRPITFYAGRNRQLYEIVVNEVRKDQMRGYVSVPKVGTGPVASN
jgi:septal ring factor EnvC (AmiA/AmiB activator)